MRTDSFLSLFRRSLPGAAVFVAVMSLPVAVFAQSPTIDLGDIFEEDVVGGLLDDLLDRTYLTSEPTEGPRETLPSGVEVHALGIRGAKFAGYCNHYDFPWSTETCDCTDGCPNLCDDPNAEPVEKEERLGVEIYFPANFESSLSNPESALLLVFNSSPPDDPGGEPNEGYLGKRRLMIDLAEEGIPAMLWYQRDDYPFPPIVGEPVATLPAQFGFQGDGAIQKAGFRWIMQRDPSDLTVEDLRFDYRFAYAQRYILSATFFRAYVRERLYPAHPDVQTWTDALRVVHAGGSKRGGGVILAGGGALAEGAVATAVDPRVVAIFVAGFQGFSDALDSGWRRYETDWNLPPTCDPCDPCDAFSREEHPWKDFAGWAWKYRNEHPSYFDAYVVERNEDRYENLLILDIVGTHDWINPLGSHRSFWRERDGVDAPIPAHRQFDTREGLLAPPRNQNPLWNYRILRRINKNHGISMIVGSHEGEDLAASDLLLRQTMLHLRYADALPRVDLVRLERVDESACRAIVRVDETRVGHVPSLHESMTVHVAFGDDLDFRRCDTPIETIEGSVCFDSPSDDNKPEEDYFIPVEPTSVEVEGDLRILSFELPAERSAFTGDPFTLIIVEGRFSGPDDTKDVDDWVVTTESGLLRASRW